MADVVFGKQYDLIGKPDRRFVVDAIEGSNVRISVLVQMTLGGLDKWLFPEAIRCRNRFVAFVNQILRDAMQETKAARPTSRNVFSILTKAYDPDTGTGFRTAEVGAESTTLIVAGMRESPWNRWASASVIGLTRSPATHGSWQRSKIPADHFSSRLGHVINNSSKYILLLEPLSPCLRPSRRGSTQ